MFNVQFSSTRTSLLQSVMMLSSPACMTTTLREVVNAHNTRSTPMGWPSQHVTVALVVKGSLVQCFAD